MWRGTIRFGGDDRLNGKRGVTFTFVGTYDGIDLVLIIETQHL